MRSDFLGSKKPWFKPFKTFKVDSGKAGRGKPSRPCAYCCGEAGKISDFMTTGTAPDDGIRAPMSI